MDFINRYAGVLAVVALVIAIIGVYLPGSRTIVREVGSTANSGNVTD